MVPKRSRAARTTSRIWAWSVTSNGNASAVSGQEPARSSTVAASRAVTTTLWPRSRAAEASARPRPVEQPVMSQVAIVIPFASR